MRLLKVSLLLGALALLPLKAEAAAIIAPHSTWEYTFTDPTVIDPSWKIASGLGGPAGFISGLAPFGNVPGSGDFDFNTFWGADGSDGDDLWVRKTFSTAGFDPSSLVWDLGVDNGYKLYINGSLISSHNAEGYTFRWEYSGAINSGLLLPGTNYVAVALEDHGGLTAFDMQITGRQVPEPASVLLLLTGLAGARFVRRRR